MTTGSFAVLGAALVVIGAGFGISKLTCAAVESIARQPEAAKDIRGTVIIAAVLIEGVSLFAAAICFMALG